MALTEQNFDEKNALDLALATRIAHDLQAQIELDGKASLAVSGGRTPVGMFQALSQQTLDWQHVVITLVDDRWVNEEHQDSNTRLVRQHLLQNNAAQAYFVPLKTDDDDAYAAQPEVEARLSDIPQPITALVLGMGEDSHTASLFPCSKEVEQGLDPENKSLCLAVTPTTAPYQRMSLTLSAIVKSPHVYLHLTGDAKKAVLGQAINHNDANARPIASVISHADVTLFWAP